MIYKYSKDVKKTSFYWKWRISHTKKSTWSSLPFASFPSFLLISDAATFLPRKPQRGNVQSLKTCRGIPLFLSFLFPSHRTWCDAMKRGGRKTFDMNVIAVHFFPDPRKTLHKINKWNSPWERPEYYHINLFIRFYCSFISVVTNHFFATFCDGGQRELILMEMSALSGEETYFIRILLRKRFIHVLRGRVCNNLWKYIFTDYTLRL